MSLRFLSFHLYHFSIPQKIILPLIFQIQVNMALRTQIVQYVTSGVRNAVRRTNLTPPRKSAFVDIFNGGLSRKKDPAVTHGLEVLEFLLEGKV